MSTTFILPGRLDSSGALPLLHDLLARRGQPLVLDAAGVEVIGALAFEVIVAAGHQWALDGPPISVTRPSDRYLAACDSLGLNPPAPWQARPAAPVIGVPV